MSDLSFWPTYTSELYRAAATSLHGTIHSGLGERWTPLPHQVPPDDVSWDGWLLLAGRGAGKTDACARYVTEHVNGPPCMSGPIPHWISIIAPTLGDAATSCYSGPSGIRAHDQSAKLTGGVGGMSIKWGNGSEAKLFGASTPDDVERLRAGGNRCLAWLEELAAWRHLQECWNHMRFGLRIGESPRWVASTTPKPRELIKTLSQNGTSQDVAVTRASTYDNPYLVESFKSALEEAYSGTQIGLQELGGQIVEQDEHALWQRSDVDAHRVDDHPELSRVAVGVDPSGGAGEQGIVVVGKHSYVERNQRPVKNVDVGYVIADYSCAMSPDGWGRRVVKAALDYDADEIVVEVNFGGDMAVSVIQGALNEHDVSVPVRTVRASRGKHPRAEPVSTLITRDRWYHVGRFDQLEDQMCTWTPDAKYSPDRLDAMVWAAWHLKLVGTSRLHATGSFAGAAMNQKIG